EGREQRANRCLVMYGYSVSPKSFQHGGPANGTSFDAHAIVPARNKCGHLRQASSYPLGDGRRRLRRIVRRLCMRTEVQITGRGDRDLSHDVIRTIHRACSLSVSLKQDCKVKGHLKSRRAGGTDADDGCGEGTGAYPMTSPSSLVDVVRSKGQHPIAHLLDPVGYLPKRIFPLPALVTNEPKQEEEHAIE
ncbi:hypothetical protein ALC62_04543, partial [Cyphomyrmex costatus]